MAGYYFNLPQITQLTISQQAALNETKQIALSGGPGTGKSVVSLWRHISNYQRNKKSLLLTFTTTLAKYLSACCIAQNSIAANNIKTSLRGKPKIGSSLHEIIVDEAQDLPISSTSLAHYFGCACIKPSKYFDNKQEDLQDKFNDFLLVTTHFGTQQTDCCLELVFTKQETDDLIDVKEGFFLYKKSLPITRVRKIFFTSKEHKEQTITNINMSTAFVPDELIEVVKKFDNIQLDKVEKPQDIHIAQHNEQLKRFDGFLGGLR